MFWNIAFVSVPIVYISYTIFEKLYPGRTKQCFITSTWNMLQCCSYFEIKAVALYNKLRSFFPERINEPESIITFVKDGIEIDKYEVNAFLSLKKHNDLPKESCDADFILYELPVVKSKIKSDKFTTCIVRYEHHEQIAKIEYNALNDFKFSVIQFNLKESSENVTSINFNDVQYLVQGNIMFDRKFLKWYMYKNYWVVISDDDEYNVTFIDHNMNYVILDHNKYIVIKKNAYDIIDLNDKDNKDNQIEDTFTML
jgi:hypothetical protein